MAARVSPPPAIENAGLAATALREPCRPRRERRVLEGADRAVPDDRARLAEDPSKVIGALGSMSRIISAAPTSSAGLTDPFASAESSNAATTSRGSTISNPSARGVGQQLRGRSRLVPRPRATLPPDAPAAARKVLAMPPADDQPIDPLGEVLKQLDLSPHLGAPDHRHDGAYRPMEGPPERIQLGHEERPRAGGRGVADDPCGRCVCAVRGAERNPSRRDRRCAPCGGRGGRPVRGLSGEEAHVLPRAPDRLARAAFRPASPGRAGTGRPSTSPRAAATGAMERAGSKRDVPRLPRWETTVTAAPAASACSRVGADARMRAVLATLPSASGTLRSARTSTRRPARSRSAMRANVGRAVPRRGRLLRGSSLRHSRAPPWYRASGWRSPTRCRTTRAPSPAARRAPW